MSNSTIKQEIGSAVNVNDIVLDISRHGYHRCNVLYIRDYNCKEIEVLKCLNFGVHKVICFLTLAHFRHFS